MPDLAHLAALAILVGLTCYAAAVDLRQMIIPDPVNLAIFVSGIAASFLLGVTGPVSALAGAVLGGGGLWLVQRAFRAYRGYDGLGLGDVKFAAAAGAWTGMEGLAFALVLASLSALLYLLARRLVDSGFDARQPMPFGPFLAVGVVSVTGFAILTGASMVEIIDAWLWRLHGG